DRQSEIQSGDEMPMPAWVGPVKAAVVVMSILIVFGLALLAYGLATGVGNRLAKTAGEVQFQYPQGMELVGANTGEDGQLVLRFMGDEGEGEILLLDLVDQKITGRVTVTPGNGYGFVSR
ncbi:MAG: hypothetical protein EBZ18_00645, partial [Alphaproteobacteria bacterium]|nr:hypothetical protein [Alphaproteobacteria bacterium]